MIGGAEIYAQWMGIADRLEITEVHARPEGDTCLAAIEAADWKEVARVRNPSGPDDSADFSYVTYMPAKVALTALDDVYIDNCGVRLSCFEPQACVVSATAVPYKACRCCEAGRPGLPTPAEETVDAVEESRRRPVGLGSERAMGLRPATGWAEAARS